MANNESIIQNKLIKYINDNLGVCYKYNEDYKSKAGVPDLFAAINNKAIFIECKTNSGRVSAIQNAVMQKIKRLGTEYVYVLTPNNYEYIKNQLLLIKKGEL